VRVTLIRATTPLVLSFVTVLNQGDVAGSIGTALYVLAALSAGQYLRSARQESVAAREGAW